MVLETGRFGQVEVAAEEVIEIPSGILGFPDDQKFCLIDSADDTLILWLQSLTNPNLAFPVLEPKIFKPEYVVRLSAAELRELKLSTINNASVFTIITLPQNLTEMTANLKAPLVINRESRIAKQVVLQENDQPIKFPMFKELRAHLLATKSTSNGKVGPLGIDQLPLSTPVELI